MPQEQILLDKLNERELEIIPLLEEGLSNKEIANQLFLAPNTVKWYVKQLNSKLDTENRHEIVERATELGLLNKPTEDNSYQRPRQNLPRQITPFIGRDAELDDIHTIIAKEDMRLLTILAQGGMGKTRIALEASEQQLNRFPDGVYFVPLQALSDVSNIVPQIATSTGFQFSNDGNSQKQQLLDFLANKTILLCIDNWEHLLDGVDLINEILQSAPDVKILATSREKLNLMSETVYVLQGMQYPNWETPEDALEYDAVQLLLQSAQRVKPDWHITHNNLDYVARVCRLTQGMPLGILLATSWLDVYSLKRICDEIQNSADILETEMRDVPQRQRSIRAVFDYSWERLTPQEQAVLMKMSVFRGGGTAQAVEAITGANARILQSLVNKSLLLRNREGRYDVHELLRQYAEVELENSGEMNSTHHIHMTYYARIVLECETKLKGFGQVEALNIIESDFENIRLAWQHAVANGYYETLDNMVMAITLFAQIYKRIQDAEKLMAYAHDNLTDSVNKILLAKIQASLGFFIRTEHHEQAVLLIDESIKILRAEGIHEELAYCLRLLSHVYNLHDYDKSIELGEESLHLYTKLEDKWGMAQAHWVMTWVNSFKGKINLADKHGRLHYQLDSENGNTFGIAWASNNLAGQALGRGDYDLAEKYTKETVSLRRQIGDTAGVSWSLNVQGLVASVREQFEEAQQFALESLELAKDINDPYTMCRPLFLLTYLSDISGDYQMSFHYARENYIITQNLQPFLKYYAVINVAWVSCHIGAYDEAIEYLLEYAVSFPELNLIQGKLTFILCFARIIASQDGKHYATQLLGLIFEYPNPHASILTLRKHPKLQELRENLEAGLGIDAYKVEWERGKLLDVDAVVQELIAEFSQEETQLPD